LLSLLKIGEIGECQLCFIGWVVVTMVLWLESKSHGVSFDGNHKQMVTGRTGSKLVCDGELLLQ
jgi:hypothetical protein